MDILDFFGLNTSSLILLILIGIAIWLVVREFRLWYWRINDIVNEQTRQTELLNELLDEIIEMKEKRP